MKEILSQSEIEALKNAMVSGEVKPTDIPSSDEVIAKKYNFRRPNKFTKDQLRTLHMIHDNFARIISNYLSGYLRNSVIVKIENVEQLTYEDFLVSIPSPTLLVIFEARPLKGNAVLELNQNFIFPIIDLLFGGLGLKQGNPRELTEIELSVMEKLSLKILENLAYVWEEIYPIKPEIVNLETNARFNLIMPPNETVVIITFTTVVGNHESLINLCLSYRMLESIVSKLSAQYWFSSQQSEDSSTLREVIVRKNLEKVGLDIRAYCGETCLTVREFLGLQQGDVIILDKNLGEDMELFIGGKPKYLVQPGIVGNKMAVQIIDKIQED
jgi:flagellar motor switch protein FliM